MSFLFASSHLPAVRSTRPELEEEEENVNPESLPRSGGVRASSHLEQRAPDSARRTDGSPAPRRADAASDWLGRLKEQMDPQRTRSAPAAPDERPRRADAEHEPDAEPDQDADEDEAPGAKSEEAPEHENTRPWYQPPESSSYHPDPGFYIRPEDGGPASPDNGFYQHPPEGEERGASDAWGDGEHPSSQDWRVRRSDESQDLPRGGQRGLGPNVPPGSATAPASGRTGAFPNSRLFEARPHPGLAGMTGAGSDTAQRMPGITQQIEGIFQNDSRPAASAAESQSHPSNVQARQSSATAQASRTLAQGKAGAQPPAASPAPAQKTAPQNSPPNGQKPKRQLSRAELELIAPDGRNMHPVGQLGITGLNTIADPNKTASGKKPITVCLYDGKEIREKDNDHYEADAAALHQAAATYASDGAYMIDISDSNWAHQLELIRDAAEGRGRGIDRIMIFDHGDSTGQEFGSTRLDPYSTEWKTITSCIKTGGDIVLMGCEVAKKDKDGDGSKYLYELYRNSNGKRRPKIHAYDGKVRHRENKLQHSVTEGEEHTIPTD